MVLSSPSSFGNRFHWHPLRSSRKMMPLSICRGSARLRPLALGGSSSRMIGSTRSQSSSGTSQMVSSVSCFPHAVPPDAFGETIRIVPETGQCICGSDFEIVS